MSSKSSTSRVLGRLLLAGLALSLDCFPHDQCPTVGAVECIDSHAGRRCQQGDYTTRWDLFECEAPFECVESPDSASSRLTCVIGGRPHPVCVAGGVCDDDGAFAIRCSGEYAVAYRMCTGCTEVDGEADCADWLETPCTDSSQCMDGLECLPYLASSYCRTRCEEEIDCQPFAWPALCSDGVCLPSTPPI